MSSNDCAGFDWSWLLNTYWYVPEENLLAYVVADGAVTQVQDQTVFRITDYDSGYFWGKTVVQIGEGSRTCYSLFGSVTPSGMVLLNFTSDPVTSDSTVTHGSGSMCMKAGEYTMLNQMASGTATMQVNHWAYMVQTRPGDPSWESLPGVGVSVPDFLSGC
jgi:hypothetical protein